MTSLRTQMRYMNPYDVHKLLINEYILKRPGDTKFFKRDTSKDRTDYDVLKDNHKFLWDSEPTTWEQQFAKKYYDKLFKEYCIADLTRYKENKIALRWRIEKEVVIGKGQFICGNKHCEEKDLLRSWEVNFAYQENGERKNALIKIRLCPICSKKLNYHSQKKEVKRMKRKTFKKKHKEKTRSKLKNTGEHSISDDPANDVEEACTSSTTNEIATEESPWESLKPPEVKSREEEMEDYLHDLLL